MLCYLQNKRQLIFVERKVTSLVEYPCSPGVAPIYLVHYYRKHLPPFSSLPSFRSPLPFRIFSRTTLISWMQYPPPPSRAPDCIASWGAKYQRHYPHARVCGYLALGSSLGSNPLFPSFRLHYSQLSKELSRLPFNPFLIGQPPLFYGVGCITPKYRRSYTDFRSPPPRSVVAITLLSIISGNTPPPTSHVFGCVAITYRRRFFFPESSPLFRLVRFLLH